MILTPFLDDYDVVVYHGDCIDVMRQLPEASVDAVVTDPPYGIGFMGKEWDAPTEMVGQASWGGRERGAVKTERGKAHPRGYIDNDNAAFQAFSEAWAREAFRVLKPGAHLLAFAGTRTYHRMASGVEDAGFEIRDCIAWMYGSGFPKSLDVSKAIDKAAGAERKIIGQKSTQPGLHRSKSGKHFTDDSWQGDDDSARSITAPATPNAAKWSGWGTALKPAFEPIVVARKPPIGTVAQNVIEHGTGALNIDATRIRTSDKFGGGKKGTSGFASGYDGDGWQSGSELGRWPANVVLDETAGAILDEQSGDIRGAVSNGRKATFGNGAAGIYCGPSEQRQGYADNGGASRFFYTAKASRQDRNVGGLADNTHPTVKPTDLMRWLVRLVTPPGGIILDPFGGSGSTGLACRAEGFRCILIEREDEYLAIIRDRLAQLSLFSVPEDDAA